ncbi:hypothetical protein GCM10025789_14550 [Tessaracoccus lubricantis]|uniref:Integral membrane protein n=1 Tax=Tessaracoccus lubricantis TaxID=545543 RepID=A0ABP9FCF1_9ACTN
MEILHGIFFLFHMIGFAALFGGAFVQLKGPNRIVNPAMWHGALTMLVSGLLLVGSLEMGDGHVNNIKIGVKLLVLIVIFVLVLMNRKKETVASGPFWGIFGLTLLNAVIAIFW